jgi:hypothetical protein
VQIEANQFESGLMKIPILSSQLIDPSTHKIFGKEMRDHGGGHSLQYLFYQLKANIFSFWGCC